MNKLADFESLVPDKNKVFIGASDKLSEWNSNGKEEQDVIDKVRMMLKSYLELDNVSFLLVPKYTPV